MLDGHNSDGAPLRKLVDFQRDLPSPAMRGLMHIIGPPLHHLLKFKELNETYYRIQRDHHTLNFFEKCLRAMQVAYAISEDDLARIPKDGPVVVVSNHPFGGLDGIVIGALLTSVRDDAKLLANHLLGRMPEIRPWLIEVDPYETDLAKQTNLKPMREAISHLRKGGMLMSFPSGTVSHWQSDKRRVTDPPWLPNTAKLAAKTGATVVPMHVVGLNSWVFQSFGLLHERVRTLLLPYEMVRRYRSTVQLRIGSPIPPRKLAEFDDPRELTEFLRLSAFILRKRTEDKPQRRIHFPVMKRRTRKPVSLVAPLPVALLEAEVASLPPEQLLVSHRNYEVYWTTAKQSPSLLESIGRLREMTFRLVDEGTGEPTDLDSFDLHYRHLFLWDKEAKAIVGAYRMGLVDQILQTHGPGGLYTTTLFKYKPSFLQELGPALEMGRSFIAPEYQRKHATLSLIWRGIGNYVVRHPDYKILFGPVSISQAYNALSKDLMVKFLSSKVLDHSLASLVRPKNPPKNQAGGKPEKAAAMELLRDVDDVSALISELEHDQKGIPVLLRHYLKLNARILAFNVDPEFGHCLDGLIVTDLTQSDPKLLRGYMGAEGLQTFLAHHGKSSPSSNKDEPAGNSSPK